MWGKENFTDKDREISEYLRETERVGISLETGK